MHSADDKLIDVPARNPIKASKGDRVEVSSDEGRMVRTMFFVFWFPLGMAGLFAWIGYEIGARLAWNEPRVLSVALGLLGFVFSIFTIYRVGKRTEAGAGLTVSRVIPDYEMPSCGSGLPVDEDLPFLRDNH